VHHVRQLRCSCQPQKCGKVSFGAGDHSWPDLISIRRHDPTWNQKRPTRCRPAPLWVYSNPVAQERFRWSSVVDVAWGCRLLDPKDPSFPEHEQAWYWRGCFRHLLVGAMFQKHVIFNDCRTYISITFKTKDSGLERASCFKVSVSGSSKFKWCILAKVLNILSAAQGSIPNVRFRSVVVRTLKCSILYNPAYFMLKQIIFYLLVESF